MRHKTCYIYDEVGNIANCYPYQVFPIEASEPQATARDTSQRMRGGASRGRGKERGGAYGGLYVSGGHRVCYAIPDGDEVEASNIVITCMIPVCHHSTSFLFDPSYTYSYMLAYFSSGINVMYGCLAEPIYISTSVG